MSIFWGLNLTFFLFFSLFCELNHLTGWFEIKSILFLSLLIALLFLDIEIFNKIKFTIFSFNIFFISSFINLSVLLPYELFILIVLSFSLYYYFGFSWSSKNLLNITFKLIINLAILFICNYIFVFLNFLINTHAWLSISFIFFISLIVLFFTKNFIVYSFVDFVKKTTILQYIELFLIFILFLTLKTAHNNSYFTVDIISSLFTVNLTVFYSEINPFLHPSDFSCLNIENIPKSRCNPLTQCSKSTLIRNKIFMLPNRDYITSLRAQYKTGVSVNSVSNHPVYILDLDLKKPLESVFKQTVDNPKQHSFEEQIKIEQKIIKK